MPSFPLGSRVLSLHSGHVHHGALHASPRPRFGCVITRASAGPGRSSPRRAAETPPQRPSQIDKRSGPAHEPASRRTPAGALPDSVRDSTSDNAQQPFRAVRRRKRRPVSTSRAVADGDASRPPTSAEIDAGGGSTRPAETAKPAAGRGRAPGPRARTGRRGFRRAAGPELARVNIRVMKALRVKSLSRCLEVLARAAQEGVPVQQALGWPAVVQVLGLCADKGCAADGLFVASLCERSHELSALTRLLGEYARRADLVQAAKLFQRLRTHPRVVPDERAYVALLKVFGSCRARQTTPAADSGVIRSLLKSPVDAPPPPPSYLQVPVECESLEGRLGLCLVANMHLDGLRPNIFVYNTLLKVLSDDLAVSLKLLQCMETTRVPPDTITFNTLINTCVLSEVKADAKSALLYPAVDSSVPGTVPAMPSVGGAGRGMPSGLASAMELYREMHTRGIPRDLITYTTLVNGLLEYREGQTAAQVLREMYADGLAPHPSLWTGVLTTLRAMREVELAFGVWADMQTAPGFQPCLLHYNVLMDTCAQDGQWERAIGLFRQLQPRAGEPRPGGDAPGVAGTPGQHLGLVPDIFSWNALLKATIGLSRDGGREGTSPVQAAIECMSEAMEAGVEPDACSWGLLVDGCAGEGDVELARKVVRHMEETGKQPDDITYLSLVRAHLTSGDVQGSVRLYRELVGSGRVEGTGEHYGMLINACKMRQEVEAGLELYAEMRAGNILAPSNSMFRELIDLWVDLQQGPQDRLAPPLPAAPPGGGGLQQWGAAVDDVAVVMDLHGLSTMEARAVVLALLRRLYQCFGPPAAPADAAADPGRADARSDAVEMGSRGAGSAGAGRGVGGDEAQSERGGVLTSARADEGCGSEECSAWGDQVPDVVLITGAGHRSSQGMPAMRQAVKQLLNELDIDFVVQEDANPPLAEARRTSARRRPGSGGIDKGKARRGRAADSRSGDEDPRWREGLNAGRIGISSESVERWINRRR